MPLCEYAGRSTRGPHGSRAGHTTGVTLAATAPALPFAQGTVFADQQIEVFALFLGKFQKYLFAFGILEPLAVAFEELVAAALAFDPDEKRFLIVDSSS